MKIAIVGGGFTGLTAAHDLSRAQHSVTVYEAAPQLGGLASGIKAPNWEWYVERYYHHIFTTDRAIIDLAAAIGRRDMIFFNKQVTAFFCREHGSHPVTLGGILSNPHLPFVDRIRYGFTAGVVLKLRNDWQRLERETAEGYMRRWAGERAYTQMWAPLLEGKFGPYAGEVNAAWLWARAKARSFKLGYFRGGFQAFADALGAYLTTQLGTIIHLASPVELLQRDGAGGWALVSGGKRECYDRVIVAAAPSILTRLVPDLPRDYTASLDRLQSTGAVVLIAALKQQLLRNGEYWFMPPKSEFPYINIVEHTNMIDRSHYGGDHVIYLGDYLPVEHRYFTTAPEEITAEWLAPLTAINPDFRPEWVKQSWLFRERYAQPVVPVNHSRQIPALRTPCQGLLWASMAHVYPWDRGTNFAVELGHRVAAELFAGN